MDKVSQIRRNCDLYTAKMVKATDTPSESCIWEGNRPENANMSAMFKPYGIKGRTQDSRMQQHQRGLTVTYLHLHEAQCVNVGTALSLPHPLGRLTSLQVNEIERGRSSIVVAGFTTRYRDGNTDYRAKGASPIATLKE